jgi:hypothetical protein
MSLYMSMVCTFTMVDHPSTCRLTRANVLMDILCVRTQWAEYLFCPRMLILS